MSNSNSNNRLKKTVTILCLVALIVFCAVLGLFSKGFSNKSAFAASAMPVTNGTYWQDIDNTSSYTTKGLDYTAPSGTYYDDHELSFFNTGRTATLSGYGTRSVYGHFISDNSTALNYDIVEQRADTGYTYYSVPSYSGLLSANTQLTAYLPIYFSSALAQGIMDPLVEVWIAPYFNFGPSFDTLDDSVKVEVIYVANATTEITLYTSAQFPFKDKANSVVCAGRTHLGNVFGGDGFQPYIKFSLSNFTQKGALSMTLQSLGLRISVTPTQGIAYEIKSTEIIDITERRGNDAPPEVVKTGDVIVITSFIQDGGNSYTVGHENPLRAINTTADGSGNDAVGRFYRKVFIDESPLRSLFRWTPLTGRARQILSPDVLSDSGQVTSDIDITEVLTDPDGKYKMSKYLSDYSGAVGIFIVLNSAFEEMTITGDLWRSDGVATGHSRYVDFSIDNLPAGQPQFLTTTTFYSKYLNPASRAYFTDPDTYIRENKQQAGGVYTNFITGINLYAQSLAPSSRPVLTNSSLSLEGHGASTQRVYYKVTAVASIPLIPPANLGFSINEANGVYCESTIGSSPQYKSLILPMPFEESGGFVVSYAKTAVFRIEFMNYDLVGNRTIGNTVYYVNVDVSDYAFTVERKLGNNNSLYSVTESDVTMQYATIKDDGTVSSFTTNSVFKRGSLVLVRVHYASSSAYSSFILTEFSTKADLFIDTTENVYSNYNTDIKQSGRVYTFEVGVAYTSGANSGGDDDGEQSNRVLTFQFKERIDIRVTAASKTYTPGIGQFVSTVTYSGRTSQQVFGLDVTVRYSENPVPQNSDLTGIVYTTRLPVNAGRYAIRCEITEHSLYYGIRGGAGDNVFFTINPASPNINFMTVRSLDYGDGLSLIDFDGTVRVDGKQTVNNAFMCMNLANGNKYYNYMSYDSVIGYYDIIGLEKTDMRYLKPSAGIAEVKVRFNPVVVTRNTDLGTFAYQYNPDGTFILDTNYARVETTVYVNIIHSTSTEFRPQGLNGDGELVLDYNGSSRTLAFGLVSTLVLSGDLNEYNRDLASYTVITYASVVNGVTGNFASAPPTNAGTYKVRVTLNTANKNCNYSGQWEIVMIISKLKLIVTAQDVEKVYQQEANPVPHAYKAVGVQGSETAGDEVTGRKYKFEYFYFSTGGKVEDIDINPYNKIPVTAGKYRVRISIDDANYENLRETTVLLTINKVSTSNSNLTLEAPAPSLVSLDMHIKYLQPLSQVGLGQTYNVKYVYREFINSNTYYESAKNVLGYFMVAPIRYSEIITYENYEDMTPAQYIRYCKEYIAGTGKSSAFICFVPHDDVNFDFLYKPFTLNVGAAAVEYELSFDNITYGDSVRYINDLNLKSGSRIGVYRAPGVYFYIGDGFRDFEYYVDIMGMRVPYELLQAQGKNIFEISDILGVTEFMEMVWSFEVTLNLSKATIYPYGVSTVPVVFTHDYPEYFASVIDSVRLTVDRKWLNIELDGEEINVGNGMFVYTYNYKAVTVPKPTIKSISGWVTSADTDRATWQYSVRNAFDGASVNDAVLQAGTYIIRMQIVENNLGYMGFAEYMVEIKADRINESTYTAPSLVSMETEAAYNKEYTLVRFSGGVMRSRTANEVISGTHQIIGCTEIEPDFASVGVGRFGAPGRRIYTVRFTPNDSRNYLPFEYTLTLTVSKNDISSTLLSGLSAKGPFIYGDLAYDVILAGNVLTLNESILPASVLSSYSFSITGRPATGSFPAGTYTGIVTVNHDNYFGSASVTVQVIPRNAYITVTENVKVFSNRTQTVTVKVFDNNGMEISEPVRQTFYTANDTNLTASLSYTPSAIGKYNVAFSLNSTNYVIDLSNPLNKTRDTLTITVDKAQISISNNEQTYKAPQNLGITMGLNDASYLLLYRQNTVYYNSLPTEAGTYDIVFVFYATNNNGYEDEIIFENKLEIHRARATISVSDVISFSYTGNHRTLYVQTTPYGLKTKVYYIQEGMTADNKTASEIFNVGNHQIMFVIDEDSEMNYTGDLTVAYNITAADLTQELSPVFTNYTYNSDVLPTLKTAGRISFLGTVKSGEYSIDLERIKFLNVGTHSIYYTFTAMNGESADKNFKVFTGQVFLTVVKKEVTLSDLIIGEISGMTKAFNNLQHSVSVEIKEGVIYDISNANEDLFLQIYYGTSTNAPRYVGTYNVTVSVRSKNYYGEIICPNPFIIVNGTPVIVTYPTTVSGKVFVKGGIITTSDLNQASGFMAIDGTGQKVEGNFIITGGSAVLNNANLNSVPITFIPTFTDRFNSRSFSIQVNAVGDNPFTGADMYEDWTAAELTPTGQSDKAVISFVPKAGVENIYGVSLSQFNLIFSGAAAEYFNGFGVLEFVNPNLIPSVGEYVEIKFTPHGELSYDYNIMYGLILIDLQKAEISDDAVFELRMYDGMTVGDSQFDIILNSLRLDLGLKVEYYEVIGGSAGSKISESITVIGSEWHNKEVCVKLSGRNYADKEIFISVSVFKNIPAADIRVAFAEKGYDGRKITPADLGITIVNTAVEVLSDAFSVSVLSNGRPSEGIDVGEYTVIIIVQDNNYYGIKEITFTVAKQNISQTLSLSFNSSTFTGAESAKPVLRNGMVNLPITDYKLYFKSADSKDTAYTTNPPINQGSYIIKAVVDSLTYSGEKTFSFTINPLTLRYNGQTRYSFQFGTAVSPEFTFINPSNGETVLTDFEIYYSSSSYTRSNKVPQNAGIYTAEIVLTNGNYRLDTSAFILEITPYNCTISTLPELAVALYREGNAYNLIYGQTLSAARFVGGEATREDVKVEGTFTFANLSDKPSAGIRRVEIIFVPINKNYATAREQIEINVAQAEVYIVYSNLSAVYTGTGKYSAVEFTASPTAAYPSIILKFFDAGNVAVVNPINAGNYDIIAESTDPNYIVVNGAENRLMITKAEVRSAIAPRANTITVGDSLAKSFLNSGENFGLVYYTNFSLPVSGTFGFIESDFVFKTAGTYTDVKYRFVPSDSRNFSEHTGVTTIVIGRARAIVTVSNNVFTYSEKYSTPTFVTLPEGLTVKHNIPFIEYNSKLPNYVYNSAHIVDANVYNFECWVVDDNYSDERFSFQITINKKEIDMSFTDISGQIVEEKYSTTYKKVVPISFILYNPNNTEGKEYYLFKDEFNKNGTRIDREYEILFETAGINKTYSSKDAPIERGTYNVTITLRNDNYRASRTVIYQVDRGVIESVSIDQNSLTQSYGAISAPIVMTEPAGVNYYIVYQGSERENVLPSAAGSYTFTVYFNDDNFNKRQDSGIFRIEKKKLSITDIVVENKVFDGTPSLKITGRMTGLMPDDEVFLVMTARTLSGTSGVGFHNVEIISYVLSGYSANNYDVIKPSYTRQVEITERKIAAAGNASYITTMSGGFTEGTTVVFTTIDSPQNKTSVFTKAMGVESTVVSFVILDNGVEPSSFGMFKVYVAIPSKYLGVDRDKLEITFEGALKNSGAIPTFEGDYITFYASAPGQIVFSKREFQYGFVVFVSSITILGVGVIIIFILNPIHRRRKTERDGARKEAIKKIKRGY